MNRPEEARSARRAVRKQHRRIRAAAGRIYRTLGRAAVQPQAAQWLTDNRWLIEEALSPLGIALQDMDRRACTARLWTLCRDFARDSEKAGTAIGGDSLRLLAPRAQSLTEKERGALFDLLKLALLSFLSDEEAVLSALRAGYADAQSALLERQASFMVRSLRLLSQLETGELLAELSPIEAILARDPVGAYAGMDEESRALYRARTAYLAEKHGLSETACAEKVLSLAKLRAQDPRQGHVGYWLFEAPLGKKRQSRAAAFYYTFSLLLPAVGTAALALGGYGPLAFAAYPVLTELVISLENRLFLRFLPQNRVFSMAYTEKLPPDARTLCVICALASKPEQAKTLAIRLRDFALAAKGGENLLFGLLLDLPEAEEAQTPQDAAILHAAEAQIEELDLCFGGFYLFTRARKRSASERRYIPPERKRGAVEELCALARGQESEIVSSCALPEKIRYLALLDADTQPMPDALARAAAVLRHPLNAPSIERGRVRKGHALMQPRLAHALTPDSLFARVHAGAGGFSLYGADAPELYQALTGETNFTGKGVVDIDAYLAAVRGALPKERVLSHDFPEGALLRAGYCPQALFLEEHPQTAQAYFAREHRWIRGDWQNLPFLLPRLRGEDEKPRKNPLPSVLRLRGADNLRRSLLPVYLLSLLLIGAFIPRCALLGWLALAVFLPEILFCRIEPKQTHQAPLSTTLARALGHALFSLCFLPKRAFVSLDAVLRALWRMAISKRHLLQWRTAAQTEGKPGGAFACFTSFLPCVLSGLALLIPPYPDKAAALLRFILAALWLSAPILAFYSGKAPKEKKFSPDAAEKQWIADMAARMYGYFRDNVGEKTHFLPPDNVQLRPMKGMARRTSPTNIGLALLAFAAAHDLGIADEEEMLSYLEAMLTSIEGMEKWNGNLYNWYSTDTAKPLYPRRVSTVDSGNLLACLIALDGALSELSSVRAQTLSGRVRRLAGEMRLAPLYDPARRLFHIGYDAEKEQPDEGHYDLLESEARLASYIAAARGEVPVRHWTALGRPIGAKGTRRGLLSWSGTMFEYRMPALFLPDVPGSLLSESAFFALYCQKRRHVGAICGISESCFFDFDEEMNYQYKAHGVQALGLKRGLDRETVFAPYALWLALPADGKAALRGLRAYEELDAVGLWGHYEALDCTPSRVDPEEKGSLVRCFMAHHVGMSLIAAANVLTDGVFIRRFMADPRMEAHRLLLAERFPVDAPIRRAAGHSEKLPGRRSGEKPIFDVQDAKISPMQGVMLPGGGIRVLAGTQGIERIVSRRRDIARFSLDRPQEQGGVRLFLLMDGKLVSLTPAPFFEEDAQYAARFAPSYALYTAKLGAETVRVRVSVGEQESAALFSVHLGSARETQVKAHLIFTFVPVLDEERAYAAHPAFSRLFLSAQAQEEGLLLSRRTRRGGADFFAFAACSQAAVCETSRERAFGRMGFRGLARVPKASSADDGTPDPICACFVPVTLGKSAGADVRFAVGCGETAEIATDAARTALADRADFSAHRMARMLHALDMTEADAAQAFSLYFRALYPCPAGPARKTHLEALREGREYLWRFGISGDFPLLAGEIPGETEKEKLLKAQYFLFLCGAFCDLALVGQAGGYARGDYGTLRELLRKFGGETLLSARAGVHLIDRDKRTAQEIGQLFALADHLLGDEAPPKPCILPPAREPGIEKTRRENPCRIEDGEAVFAAAPALAWSHILANEDFGFLACDSGAGNLWYKNAQENRISPWVNDPLAFQGPEELEFVSLLGRGSLFSRGEPCRVRYLPGFAVWESERGGARCALTAFVHPTLPARVFDITIEGDAAAQAELLWTLELQLGPSTRDARFVRTGRDPDSGVLLAENPAAGRYGDFKFFALSWPRAQGYTCDRRAAQAGVFDGVCGAGHMPCMALRIRPARDGEKSRAILVVGCAEDARTREAIQVLCTPDGAEKAKDAVRRYWARLCGDLQIETPDGRINAYLNGFAAYQVVAGRLFARHSLYQSSGAYGFRDQLQDVCALLALPPQAQRHALVRRQILRAAAHQYREGDVQHWWHEDADLAHARGVRTRVSDDLLFLPYAAALYVQRTGDEAFLTERAPFLVSAPLGENETERLESAAFGEAGSIWEHCARALDCMMRRGVGAHGLARIGGGDWNDAMNEVGVRGRGESVWLSFFAACTMKKMAVLGEKRGEKEKAALWRQTAQALLGAGLDAWDGDHFLRGWHDDGTPIGSNENDACRIDAITQAFAVLAGPPEGKEALWHARTDKALESAKRALWDGQLIRLFTPPFTQESAQEPGYIKGYPPGVRENGGQYTHGAVWLAMAFAEKGQTDTAAKMLSALAPSGRQNYLAEPYYLAADVYAAKSLYGRAGWTIYTGAAGWYLRAVYESLLGLRFTPGHLELRPRLPKDWPFARVEYEKDGARLSVEILKGGDGDKTESLRIPWPPEKGERKITLRV